MHRKIVSLLLAAALFGGMLLLPADAAAPAWPSARYQMPFRPEKDSCSAQNPPDFSWPHVDNAVYHLIVCEDEALRSVCFEADGLEKNVFNFSVPFETEKAYYWAVRYTLPDGSQSEWSEPSRFVIDKDASVFTVNLPVDFSIFQRRHPFMIPVQREKIDAKAFEDLYLQVERDMENPLPAVNAETASKDGYQYAERVARGALLFQMTGKERYRNFAVSELCNLFDLDFRTLFEWNQYSDTVEPIFAYHIALAYDWLYQELDGEQRDKTVQLIENSIERPFERFQNNGVLTGSMYHKPYNSHAWRMNQVMAASFAIAKESELAREVIAFQLPLFLNLFAGVTAKRDGGSSQGAFYGLSNDQEDVAEMVTSLGIADMRKKECIRNLDYNLLYLWPDNWIRMIGDGYRQKPLDSYQYKLRTQKRAQNSENAMMRSVNKWLLMQANQGESAYCHRKGYTSFMAGDLGETEALPPAALPDAGCFPETGQIAMFSDLTDSDRIGMLFNSNPTGSYNHGHPDQNSFVIQAFGETLAIDSDYYDFYHSDFDLNWNRKTYAHNAVTFDGGTGQLDGDIWAKGGLTDFLNHSSFGLAGGEAGAAYGNALTKAGRRIIYLKPDVFIAVDDLKSDTPKSYEWWLNTEGDIAFSDSAAVITKGNAHLSASVCYPQTKAARLDGFTGPDGISIEPPEMAEGSTDKRVYFRTEPVANTKMVTVMQVYQDSPKEIQYAQYEDYCKISCEGQTVYVRLSDGGRITADGYTFDGDGFAVSDGAFMLINGRLAEKDGEALLTSDQRLSAVVGNDEISISSMKADANVRLYSMQVQKLLKIDKEKALPIPAGTLAHGVTWNREPAYTAFSLYPGAYQFTVNESLPRGHYRIETAVQGKGSVACAQNEVVPYGDTRIYTVSPADGYYIGSLTYNDIPVEVNAENRFKTPPLECNGRLEAVFLPNETGVSPSVSTFQQTYTVSETEEALGTITFGKIISYGLPVSEYGILCSRSNNDFRLENADGSEVRKFAAKKSGYSGDFGVKLVDLSKGKILGEQYYTRAYAVVNNYKEMKILYGDVVSATAFAEEEYSEQKDARLSGLEIGGVPIPGFQPDTFAYYTSPEELGILLTANTQAAVRTVADSAASNVTYSYFFDGDQRERVRSGRFEITVTSEDGSVSQKYTVHCYHDQLLPVLEDTDIRAKPAASLQGTHELLYVTSGGVKALMKFDISHLAEWKQAILVLYEQQLSTKLVPNHLTFYETENILWSEKTLVALNAPNPRGKIAEYTTQEKNEIEKIEIDVSDYLRKCLANGDTEMSIMIAGTELSSFSSKERQVAEYRPVIKLKNDLN